MNSDAYPVHLSAQPRPDAGRWLWLVKWLLIIPHIVVLVFLWIGAAVAWLIALVAILFTGRYPRTLFDYVVGVLRWSWRVEYYAYAAGGTDRYPPFRLADVPDYPAHLDVDYPERLSRGLVLVKWWLLAIPHYIVVGILVGRSGEGGRGWADRTYESGGSGAQWTWDWSSPGLILVLVVIALVILAFTAGYPRDLYRLIIGLDRWRYRVAGYAALTTDAYPPFRLDMDEDGEVPAAPRESPDPAPR